MWSGSFYLYDKHAVTSFTNVTLAIKELNTKTRGRNESVAEDSLNNALKVISLRQFDQENGILNMIRYVSFNMSKSTINGYFIIV